MELPMKRIMFLLMFFGICIFSACTHSTDKVLLWPSTATRNSSSDYIVDAALQLDALRRANPAHDAEIAFKSGDFRFIADRPVLPRIQGIPDDTLVNKSRIKYGLKVVAFSDALLTNVDFLTLKTSYEDLFNRQLYRSMGMNRSDR
jgi:hypothetical protein